MISIFVLLAYFSILAVISYLTSRKATSHTFFVANRRSPWYLVAFGMVGVSLSGITFISVPANVGVVGFGYFQVVLGYWVGYWVIMGLLMPLYYKLNLMSIYGYLGQRFDPIAHKTGSVFFLLSRTIGSSLRLFLAAVTLQLFLFDAWEVPFYVTVAITIFLIWAYTSKGGIKTIVWTDTLQTTCMIAAVVITSIIIVQRLDWSFMEAIQQVADSTYSRMFYWDDVNSKLFFPKQFFGGALIAIAMTGLDQDLMQKNLTCKDLKSAQKNMFWFSIILLAINLLFLFLGALLYLYSTHEGVPIPHQRDDIFPMLAMNKLGTGVGVCFLLGVVAAAYSSSDSALTALTTSFCVDFLNFDRKDEATKKRQKNSVHLLFSVLIFVVIILFSEFNNTMVIDATLTIAGYTYGPLLGLFAFGLFTKKKVRGKWIPLVCVLSPLLSYLIALYTPKLTGGYQIGIEILGVNGLLSFIGLYIIAYKKTSYA